MKHAFPTIPASAAAPPSARALTPEWAAKLGHVCTAQDPLVREMLAGFQDVAPGADERPESADRASHDEPPLGGGSNDMLRRNAAVSKFEQGEPQRHRDTEALSRSVHVAAGQVF